MGLFQKKEPVVEIQVTDIERQIIIHALKQMRDNQIKQDKSYDFIESIISKSVIPKESSIGRKSIVTIYVSDVERRILINALNQKRDAYIKQDKPYDFIERIIQKSAMAETVKKRPRAYER